MSWIKCSEKQPRDGEVIVYSVDCNIQSQVGRYCAKGEHMPSAPNWLPWDKAVYWMPLPEPPKDE